MSSLKHQIEALDAAGDEIKRKWAAIGDSFCSWWDSLSMTERVQWLDASGRGLPRSSLHQVDADGQPAHGVALIAPELNIADLSKNSSEPMSLPRFIDRMGSQFVFDNGAPAAGPEIPLGDRRGSHTLPARRAAAASLFRARTGVCQRCSCQWSVEVPIPQKRQHG